jgi:Secretion system C-terminal sorting domain
MKKHIYFSLLLVALTALFSPLKACQDTVLFTPQYSFEGEHLIVELYQTQKTSILSFQVGFLFDANVLKLDSTMVYLNDSELSPTLFNTQPGWLRMVYVSNNTLPEPVDITKPFVILKFKVLDTQASSYFVLDPNFFHEFSSEEISGSCISMTNNPLDINFGTVTGNALLDTNEDCIADAGSRILKDWMVVFDNGTNTFVRNTKTDGSYSAGLQAGSYTVSLVPKNDLYAICTPPTTVTVVEDQTVSDMDFTTNAIQSCAILQTNVNAAFFRRCFDNSVRIKYENIGTVTAEDPTVAVILDEYMTLVSTSVPHTLDGDTLVFALGTVEPDASGYIDIVVNIDCQGTDIGQTHCITALGYPNEPCDIPTNYAGSDVIINGVCDNDEKVVFTLTNVGQGNMPAALQYIVIEDDVMRPPVTYQLMANESLVVDLDADGKTYTIITQNEIDYPGLSRPHAFVEGCGTGSTSTGFVNLFSMNDADPFIDILCLQNIGAYDPNDITGYPYGYGAKKYIEKYDKLEYKIRFQNTGTDTAFNIVIRNVIEDHLDISTFKMTVASHDYSYQFDKDRQLVVTFKDIQLVDSFKNEALSHGYLVYEIYPSDVLNDEDRIDNRAEIYFDFNTPIQTNTENHTIGRPIFVSSVISYDPKVQVSAYPNPTNSNLIIDVKKKEHLSFNILDFNGKVIQTGSYHHESGIDCTTLNQGIYIVQILDHSNAIATVKFIKN